MLALELVQQAAQLGAARARALGAGAVHQRAQQRQRDRLGRHAQALAAAREQVRALLLQQLPAADLAAQDARQAHDRVHVARADRRALLEHDLEQTARGG